MMKAILSVVLLAILAATLLLPLAENSILAQAPTGPQGGAPPPQQQQQNPASPTPPSTAQQPPQAGVTIAVDVPIVTVDVVATTSHGDIIPGLKKENFRVLDDGVPQTISNFSPTEAPITMVVLMQFSGNSYGWFAYYAKYWAEALFPNLQPKDWVALETFDRLKDVTGKKSILVLASGVDMFSKHTLQQPIKKLFPYAARSLTPGT